MPPRKYGTATQVDSRDTPFEVSPRGSPTPLPRKPPPPRRSHATPRRPRLELLEDRIVLWNTYVSLGDADAVWSFTILSYSDSNLLDGWLNDDGLTTTDITDAVEESMGAWTAVTPLTFFQLADSGPPPGDGPYDPIGRPFLRWGHHDIDGATVLNVLAHGRRPGDNGINGDMHFDDGNTWTFNTFMETAIHEFGHAIGMAHANGDIVNGQAPTPKPAIMDALAGIYSFNGRGSAFLFQDDVDGIRSLYGTGLGFVINSSGALNITAPAPATQSSSTASSFRFPAGS